MSNRIVLKVELIEETKVKITVLYLDKRFLSVTDRGVVYFDNRKQDFLLYSSEDQLHIESKPEYYLFGFPKLEFYKPNISIEYDFEFEDIRKKYLKKLSECLFEWSENFTFFVNSDDYECRARKLKFQDKFLVYLKSIRFYMFSIFYKILNLITIHFFL